MVERQADGRIRTTEWEDVQYKHGNVVGAYASHEVALLAQRMEDVNPNAHLPTFDPQNEKLEEAETRRGGSSSESDEELSYLRQQRLSQLKLQGQKRSSSLRDIDASIEYIAKVTEASTHRWVLALLLLSDGKCSSFREVFSAAAHKKPEIDFVAMNATDAVSNYPQRRGPSVLFYRHRQLLFQLTGYTPWTEDGTEEGIFSLDSVLQVLDKYNLGKAENDGHDDKAEVRFLRQWN